MDLVPQLPIRQSDELFRRQLNDVLLRTSGIITPLHWGAKSSDDSSITASAIAWAEDNNGTVFLPNVGTPWVLDGLTSAAPIIAWGGLKWKAGAQSPMLTLSNSLSVALTIDGNEANNPDAIADEIPLILLDHVSGMTFDLSMSTATGIPSALFMTDEFSANGRLVAPALSKDSSGAGQFIGICCKGWQVWGLNTENVCNADGWLVRVGHFTGQDRSALITDTKVVTPILIGNTNGDSTSGSGILCELDAVDTSVVQPTLRNLFQAAKIENETSSPGCNADGLTITEMDASDLYATTLTFNLKGSGVNVTGKVSGQGIVETGADAKWNVDWTDGGPTGGTEPVVKCRGPRARIGGKIINPLQDGVKLESTAPNSIVDVYVEGCTTDCIDSNAEEVSHRLVVNGTPAVGVRCRSPATENTISPDSFFDGATDKVSSAVTDSTILFQPPGTLVRNSDANGTLSANTNPKLVQLTGTYTATRTTTVNVTGSGSGAEFIIYRTGGSSGGVYSALIKDPGGTTLATLATNDACHVANYAGTWVCLRKWTPPA